MTKPNLVSGEGLHDRLRQELAAARARTDELFQMVTPKALYERPIAERHRIVFYLGHLDAFDWNMICNASFGASSFNAEFDRLFAFGIDPVDGQLPADQPADWPRIEEIHAYNRRVRETVDDYLDHSAFVHSHQPFVENGQIFWVAIEHRLMHAETLAYMLHWLPFGQKVSRARAVVRDITAPEPRMVEIPAGLATLGQKREVASFGWDNEFEAHDVFVPAFSIDAFDITNGQFLEFVRSGGYDQRTRWNDESWHWIQGAGIRHPKFWVDRDGKWFYRTMFDEIPLPLAWPVYVSHAEAEAYARWVHKSLPTEAQFHRAAFGAGRQLIRGNLDFQSWTPAPVGMYPANGFGVFDLVGNGWEWTSTVFQPFRGFQPFPFYPGYSANFFDGKHYVLKGASPRTSILFGRQSFRNWFQPHYQNVYATFRCVEN